MKYRVAINGFGRIGRLTLRSLIERNVENLEIVAVNDLGDLKSNLHLFKYDISLEDLKRLKLIKSPYLEGVISGKALYEGKLDFSEAQALADQLSDSNSV